MDPGEPLRVRRWTMALDAAKLKDTVPKINGKTL